MSLSPESSAKHSSTNDSETSGGFRSFWKKSDKSAQAQNVTFVQQDPAGKRKTNRIGRLFKGGSPTSSQDNADDDNLTSAQKRRQQVYQAQKRHRNRKSEYVQNLEAEIARLQHLDARVNSEKNALAHQNNAMKQFLASKSLDTHLESVNLSSSSAPSDDLSQLGGASVDIRFDPEMGHERTFLDIPEMVWTSSEASTEDGQPQRAARNDPVAGDSWAALDFILALEWPCREHIAHHGINPTAKVPEACATGHFHGHALTSTAAVYQSAQPPSVPQQNPPNVLSDGVANQYGLDPSTLERWQLPHSEIDKLVELSETLELDEDSMTPAQAYTAVRESLPGDEYLRPTLEALKKPLGSLVQCHGFGACMDSPMFWQHLDETLQNLNRTNPGLGKAKAKANP